MPEPCPCPPQPLRVLVVGPWLSPVCALHSRCVCWWWVRDWVLSVSSTAAACTGGGSVTESCPCPPQPLRALVVGPWLSPVCALHSRCVCWSWVRDWVLSVSSTAAACAGGGSVTGSCLCPPQPLRVLVVGPWLSPVCVLHSRCVCWWWVRGWVLSVSTAAACAGGGSVTESCLCPPQPLRVLVVGPWLSPVCVHSRCVCWWWVRDWVLSVSSTAAACAGRGSVTESCLCPPQPLRALVVGPWLSPVCVLHSRCMCWWWIRDWVLSVSSTAAACAGRGSVTESCLCPPQPLRVLVVGPPGVGKSTVVRQLCSHYKLHHVHAKDMLAEALDALQRRIARAEAGPEGGPEGEGEAEAEEEDEGRAQEDAELMEAVNDSREENGRMTDTLFVRFMRDKLRSKPCQNQGFILDGFPKTMENATDTFAGTLAAARCRTGKTCCGSLERERCSNQSVVTAAETVCIRYSKQKLSFLFGWFSRNV